MDEAESRPEQQAEYWTEIGRSVQHKGMFFSPGLAFTAFAAATQTFRGQLESCWGVLLLILELCGWGLLLFAGIAGLSWIHNAGQHYMAIGDMARASTDLEKGAAKARAEMFRERSATWQSWHRYVLIAGLIAVAVARAIGVFSDPGAGA